MVIAKIIRHARQGTLIPTLRSRIIKPAKRYRVVLRDLTQASKSDIYHGEVAEGYLERRAQSWKWQTEQAIMRELLKRVPDGAAVLDVPFGTGRFVPMYLDKGMHISGVDISPDMIAAAEKALGEAYRKCNVSVGSADALPFADKRFDLIVCCRFISMLPLQMARKVLSELHRVSKSTVFLYMNVQKPRFDLSTLLERLSVLFGGSPRYMNRLGSNMKEEDFVELLGASGFNVQDRRVIRDDPKNTYLFYVLDKQRPPR